uniref:(northern house mosquito) hypothetical protein n=2 Tax=Culex pipiens TaxID=7175 RepID=A0A8D8FEX1_CULPI
MTGGVLFNFTGGSARFMYGENYELINNRKGGLNLLYEGYVYRRKADYASTVNWVCANPNTARFISDPALVLGYTGVCAARCVTNKEGGIKLGKKGHNHPPIRYNDETKEDFLLTY